MDTSWPIVEIGELCMPVEKVDPLRFFPLGEFRYIDISSIDSVKYQVVDVKEYQTKDAPSRARQLVKEDDILLSTVRTNLKRIARVGRPLHEQIASTGFVVLRASKEVHPSYLFYYLTTSEFTEEISSMQRGASYPAVRASDVLSRKIPLAPLPEQKRIVAKLDTLFAHVDQLRTRLDKIPVLLKQFRQAVLTQAVTGKLTAEWRGKHKVGAWTKAKTSECCSIVQSGGTPREGFSRSGIPFLKVYNIVNQKVDFFYRPQFIPLEIHKKGQKKSVTFPGDVLMNIVGPPLGKVAIVPEDFNEWSINQAITLFRPKGYLNNKYLYYYFCQGNVIGDIINETRGMVGQSNISLTQCRNFEIAIPSLEEQTEIVRRVEGLFGLIDRIEGRYKVLRKQIDSMRPCVLSMAFTGRMTQVSKH